jgi:hypothetical protein
MPESQFRYMCDDLERAAQNREMVKQKACTKDYPTDEELQAKGIPIDLTYRQHIRKEGA